MIVRLARAATTLGLALLLAACGGAAPTASPPPTNTPPAPTATPVPPTATAVPPTAPRPAATPATPSRAATPTSTGRLPAGRIMTDSEKRCQLTLTDQFLADLSGNGNATSNDDNAYLNLSSFPTEPLGFEATTKLFIDGFAATIADYKEADRQSGTDRGRPYSGVTFTATLVGEPMVGQFYFVQEGATTCALSILVQASAASDYSPSIGALIDSVQAIKP